MKTQDSPKERGIRGAQTTVDINARGAFIGFGYSLRFSRGQDVRSDWSEELDATTLAKVLAFAGKDETEARQIRASTGPIEISFESASRVFAGPVLRRSVEDTRQSFPNTELLHPDSFGALVALVYARGTSLSGRGRAEMMNIRQHMQDREYEKLPAEIRSMKRLGDDDPKLAVFVTQREDEAALFEYGVKRTAEIREEVCSTLEPFLPSCKGSKLP